MITRRALLAAAGLTAVASCSAKSSCADDPVLQRALDQIGSFLGWLDEHHVEGMVGEVGWPNAEDWQSMASQWLGTLREHRVPATLWASALWWPADHALSVYRATPGSSALDLGGATARTAEQALRSGSRVGIALADGTFGASMGANSTYSAHSPGRYGVDYIYPTAASLRFLAKRGYRDVRLAVTWERLQRTLGGGLDNTEVGRIRRVLDDAAAAGLRVELDLHNYGRYAGWADGRRQVWALGSPQLPAGRLADLWARAAGAFKDRPALASYGLMNEPHNLPGGAATWESASRIAIDALRAVDKQREIHVDGHAWSSARTWATEHPKPWLTQSGVVYSVHQYFDQDGTGTYSRSYAAERSAADQACND